MNKHQVDITEDKQAMSKFRKEANELKIILSTNKEAVSTIKNAYRGIDYRRKIKRSQFEAASRDLKPRFTIPLHTCLVKAGLSFADVTSVILTGGASRTPMIYQAVKAAVGERKVVASVDADEAAVLGAGLYGASLSPQFKTKGVDVSDIYMYDVMVSYPTQHKDKSPNTFTTIFPPGSKTGSKKTLTIKNEDDFSIGLLYRKIPFVDHPRVIFEAKIGGVPEAIANLTENGVINPVIEATVILDESGFVSISHANAVGKVKRDTKDDITTSGSGPRVTVPLTVDFEFGSTRPMTPTEKRLARHRLRETNSIGVPTDQDPIVLTRTPENRLTRLWRK